MNRKAVVAGATGLIGKELVQLLLEDPAYTTVILIVRRSMGIKHPKIHEKIIDFDQLNHIDVDLTGADVYCTLGTTIKKAGSQETFRKVDYDYPLTLGKIAKTSDANQLLIVTSIGANPTSRSFYTRVKGQVEEALREHSLPALHIFRPSLLLGNRQEFRMGEQMAATVSKRLLPLFVGPLRKYSPIYAQTVAKAMVIAAKSGLSGIRVYESNQIAQMSETSK